MKAKLILDYFLLGDLHHENTCKVHVNEFTSLEWLIGAVDGRDIRLPYGEYVVYYHRVEDYNGVLRLTPDYTFHDCDNNDIYLLKID